MYKDKKDTMKDYFCVFSVCGFVDFPVLMLHMDTDNKDVCIFYVLTEYVSSNYFVL